VTTDVVIFVTTDIVTTNSSFQQCSDDVSRHRPSDGTTNISAKAITPPLARLDNAILPLTDAGTGKEPLDKKAGLVSIFGYRGFLIYSTFVYSHLTLFLLLY
jgi:hypothetical protein